MYSYSKIAQTLQKKTTRYYPATSWYIVNYSEIGQTLQKRTTRYYVPTSWETANSRNVLTRPTADATFKIVIIFDVILLYTQTSHLQHHHLEDDYY